MMIGNPTSTDHSDRSLMPFVNRALDKLAARLKYSLTEDEVSLGLETGVKKYQLPPEVDSVIWVELNGVKLKSVQSTYEWDLWSVPWRDATPGVPDEFAVEGREIFLYPPPSAATVAAYPRAKYKFHSSSPGINEAGLPKLPNSDARIGVTMAALFWCTAFPTPENQARARAYSAFLSDDLREADERHERPVEDAQPGMKMGTTRQGAAR